jgi:hypothetical protein
LRQGTVLGSFIATAAACSLAAACGPQQPQLNGYKPGIDFGMTKDQVVALLGAPKEQAPFNLMKLSAYVMTYPFGQLLLEDDRVVAMTVTDAPAYVGPLGIKLGLTEDAVKALYHAHQARRLGHQDAYDVVVGQNDTRTRDLYDQTDHLMIEMAAANPNDPMAPFNVVSITRANDAGLTLLSELTKAKLGGLYPDQHVFNFTSEPWST